LVKRLAVLLALLALLVPLGCGGDDDDDGGGAAGTTAAETTGEKALQIGLVTDLGQLTDRGFNQLAYQGLKQAQRELGVKGRVVQSASASDYIPNMRRLARDGYDLIIGVGFAQGDAVDTVAGRFPQTKFAIIDVDQSSLEHKPKNVVGLIFKEQEVGYLAGYLAALEEKRRSGADVIGSVGGFKEPPVDRFIAGYQAGAKKAVPGIKVLNGYSSDWDDQAKCKELALNQISQGAGVVFQVAGGCGLGALDAARQEQVWGIGVDADQSYLGGHVLTSAQKKVDSAVVATIKSIQDGTWQGGTNAIFGLKENGVGLGTISDKAPPEDVAAVEEISKQIADGEISNIPTTVK
jgi:basic membrane protein A and related proteins